MYILDTNACIYMMKNSFPELSKKVFEQNPSKFNISAITIAELEYGASKSKWGEKTRNTISLFLAPFTVLDFNEEDARMSGRVRAQLESIGLPIGLYDLQIASQGLTRGYTVITRNVAEFKRVPGLHVEDWT